MKNMKISAKLFTCFGVVLALAMAIGVAGIIGQSYMSSAANEMYRTASPMSDLLVAVYDFSALRYEVSNAVLHADNIAYVTKIEGDMRLQFIEFEDLMRDYEYTITGSQGQELFDEIMDKYSRVVKPGMLDVIDKIRAGASLGELIAILDRIENDADVISADLKELGQIRTQIIRDRDASTTALARMMLILIISVIVVAIAVAVFMVVKVSGMITKPLIPLTSFMVKAGTTGELTMSAEEDAAMKEYSQYGDETGRCMKGADAFARHIYNVSKVLKRVAEGDLTVHLTPLSDKDTMGFSLQHMMKQLNMMFGEINASSSQVNSASGQIAEGAQNLAQSSTEQAASVQQLSSSIQDMSGQIKETASMTNKCADLSQNIKEKAEKGSNQMDELMQAVREITDASTQIEKVIKVIDDIAFQTNILALNAAVEAARAGAAGKGFAVVAEEVRNLASKSAEAAKDTSGLIENSINKASLGLSLATNTSSSLHEIVNGISENAAIISDIAMSSSGQSTAISELNIGVEQVANVIQQNSAIAEQSAAASEEMSGQTDVLKGLVAQFKLS
ncbi:MAG: methyl-accepting chemotaxis protein [Oscillospiraceae bacterium]|jgi:methyl-accepting chemotaxis protein|nr:methyl-accepting chemotaxis protein [Oscillospiraceae bacterium]